MPEKDHLAPDKKKHRCHPEEKPASSSGATALFSVTKYLLFLLTAIIAVIVLFFDTFLLYFITAAASRMTGAEVTLENVETSFLRGDIKLINLRIKNPQGFDDAPGVEAGAVYLRIDRHALFDGVVVIKELEARNLHLYGTINREGKINFRELLQRGTFPTITADNIINDSVFRLEKIHLENVSAVIKEDLHHNRIGKFGFSIRQLTASITDGEITIQGLHLTPPGGCSHSMMELGSAQITMVPETIFSETPVIENIRIDGLNATAALHDTFRSNFHVINDAFNRLFQATAQMPEIVDDRRMSPVIKSISLHNSSLSVWDERPHTNIHGFGMRFENFFFNLASGRAELKNLTVTNPKNYSRNMLEVKNAAVDFAPESIFSTTPVFENIQINGISAYAGFRGDNRSNVTEVIHSIRELLQAASPAPGNPDEEQEMIIPEIKKFDLSDVSFTVADYRDAENINGFGASFHKLSGSLTAGELLLLGLKVKNPRGYNRDMLEADSISLNFVPESLTEPITRIRQLRINGVKAVAGLRENNHSNIHDVINTFTVIFFPLFFEKPSFDPQEQSYFSTLQISNLILTDCSLSIWDSRNMQNFHGFSASIKEFQLSKENGIIMLKELKLNNPRGYRLKEMLSIGSLRSEFTETADGTLITRSLLIDSLHAFGEFKPDGKFNMHEAADLLCFLSGVKVTCPLPPDSTPKSTISNRSSHTGVFKMTSSTFSLWDARRQMPLKIPINQDNPEYQFTTDPRNTLLVMHEDAATLERECANITDIGKLLFYFLNNTAESGVELLKKSGDTGKNFLDFMIRGFK